MFNYSNESIFVDMYTSKIVFAIVCLDLALNVNMESNTIRGSRDLSLARHITMYVLHVSLGFSFSRICSVMQRNKSTVSYACHKIEDKRDKSHFDKMIDSVEKKVIITMKGLNYL